MKTNAYWVVGQFFSLCIGVLFAFEHGSASGGMALAFGLGVLVDIRAVIAPHVQDAEGKS